MEMRGEIVVGDSVAMLTVEEYYFNYQKQDAKRYGPYYFQVGVWEQNYFFLGDREFERIR